MANYLDDYPQQPYSLSQEDALAFIEGRPQDQFISGNTSAQRQAARDIQLSQDINKPLQSRSATRVTPTQQTQPLQPLQPTQQLQPTQPLLPKSKPTNDYIGKFGDAFRQARKSGVKEFFWTDAKGNKRLYTTGLADAKQTTSAQNTKTTSDQKTKTTSAQNTTSSVAAKEKEPVKKTYGWDSTGKVPTYRDDWNAVKTGTKNILSQIGKFGEKGLGYINSAFTLSEEQQRRSNEDNERRRILNENREAERLKRLKKLEAELPERNRKLKEQTERHRAKVKNALGDLAFWID